MGEDRGLLNRMDGLDESMKLIMTTLNIGGMENQRTTNEDIGAVGGSIHTGNLVNELINCTQPDPMKDEVIVGAKIAVKVG